MRIPNTNIASQKLIDYLEISECTYYLKRFFLDNFSTTGKETAGEIPRDIRRSLGESTVTLDFINHPT
jgi:hypothetical protein